MILPCSCQSEYQNRVHGAGLRVHTPMMNGNFRCTICGTTRSK